MIPHTPEPERGLVLAVLAQGTDPDHELAEVEELSRTAGLDIVTIEDDPQPGHPGVFAALTKT